MNAYRGIQWVKEGILPYPKHGPCVHYEPAVMLFSGVEIGEVVQYSSKEILLKCGAGCPNDKNQLRETPKIRSRRCRAEVPYIKVK